MSKPSFYQLWAAFPDHMKYTSLESLYTFLGGQAQKNINIAGFGPNGNTCASRLSVAFNATQAPINESIAKAAGARILKTANGQVIIYGVGDFKKYLLKSLGKPKTDKSSPFDDSIKGRKGLIAFNVNWGDATGHIALWNGSTYREPSHDNYATYVNPRFPNIKTSLSEFWELT